MSLSERIRPGVEVAPWVYEEVRTLESELRFYKEREAYFARLLNVTDGGQYRADWDGALARLIRERDAAQAEVTSLGLELRYAREDKALGGRCTTTCSHGSRCKLSAPHDGGHHTEHDCICYDLRPALFRASNWTPPANGARSFLGRENEPCVTCGARIGSHFGGQEYRCDPRCICIGPSCGGTDCPAPFFPEPHPEIK